MPRVPFAASASKYFKEMDYGFALQISSEIPQGEVSASGKAAIRRFMDGTFSNISSGVSMGAKSIKEDDLSPRRYQ
ncbi:hypothetical protein N7478_001240 [Penicillium angulare]|uniref:uncharacterized protein n=1 Tax=Penicillium angulare TaxID=116970 RepID=UPI00253F6ECB|nr:uncharacterized protein N7478_001240 [Penicillium angulare]KAJ5291989.1 hypothetical protein N7478_001240 [Penicillium angulare]